MLCGEKIKKLVRRFSVLCLFITRCSQARIIWASMIFMRDWASVEVI